MFSQTLIVGVLSLLHWTHALPANRADAVIKVDAGSVISHISPFMTGSCIEDVNHEIYGGLYAQLIFGESFEEPPAPVSPIAGWQAFGGAWRFDGEALHVDADAGAKLVLTERHPAVLGAECDIRLDNPSGGNASLLLCVSEPAVGADNWIGYEIAISARDKSVSINRHHHDWLLLKSARAEIRPGEWMHLRAASDGQKISVYLGDSATPAIETADPMGALAAGTIGVRTWNCGASFRHVRATLPAGHQSISLIPNPSPSSGMSGMWSRVQSGSAQGRYKWDAERPYNSEHSQNIEFMPGGTGTVGVSNMGLNKWGICLRKGHTLNGSLYLKGQPGSSVTVALQSADGSRTYAASRLSGLASDWKRFAFKLTSQATDAAGRFAIWLDRPGSIRVDQVTLMPTGGDLFHGLPIRADIANGLKREGVRFLRYGGTMVNAPTYRFKSMIGPRELRPQFNGNWYAYSTNGFGIEEFIQFCRVAGIEPAFAINIDETPEDAADMVEYLNGPADSVWGHKRAENGHLAPYGVRYIEIGNEEALDGNKDWYRRYLNRFKVLEPALHAKDPKLQLVIAAWWRPDEPICREIAQALNGKAALWDVHVGGDGLHDGDDVEHDLTTMQAKLQEWTPASTIRACIFEENGGRHDIQRALGHAHILNVTERHADFVRMDCPANCLQPWLQNDNGWDQGQLFFTPDSAWGMPPYYAQRMAAKNYEPLCVQSEVRGAHDLSANATRSADGKTLVLKVVNLGATAHSVQIELAGFDKPHTTARKWTLSGDLNGTNTPTDKTRFVPVEELITRVSGQFEVDIRPYSYTVMRMERP